MLLHFRICLAFLILTLPDTAIGACGTRGGPGYRGPTGKCVGWAEMARVCGSPPTTKCKAEAVAPGSDAAAFHGAEIEKLRSENPSSKK